MENTEKKSFVTFVLVAANVVLLFIMEGMGGSTNSAVLVRMGAVVPEMVREGQYWRLFTAMFLHIGFGHLLSNMISLFIFGTFMEQSIGHVRYLIIYLGSGVLGNVLTCLLSLRSGEASLTAGASGAIFGLMGALIALALFRRSMVRGMTPMRVIIVVILMLLPGFTTPNVSISGHIGGVIGGFLITLLMLPTFRGYRQAF